MRILIANHTRLRAGGAESYLSALLKQGPALGVDFALLVENQCADRDSIDVTANVTTWRWSAADARAVEAKVTAWAPEVVYAHGLNSSDLEAWLVEQWPSALYAHNYYGTCITGEKRHQRPSPTICTRPLGVGCFTHCYTQGCGTLNPLRLRADFRIQTRRRAVLPRYQRVVVASEAMRKEFIRNGAPRVSVLPLFVERGVRPNASPTPEGPVALVGRLTNLKGGEVLLRAVASLPTRREVVVAGDGPERAKLERLGSELGLAVRFRGWLRASEIEDVLTEASILAMPSLWPEPFGLVGLEAASFGKPVVAFAVGGIPEWLERGVVGEMPAEGDLTVRGFSDALSRALQPARYPSLSQGAIAVAARFSLATHLEGLRRLFSDVAREDRP